MVVLNLVSPSLCFVPIDGYDLTLVIRSEYKCYRYEGVKYNFVFVDYGFAIQLVKVDKDSGICLNIEESDLEELQSKLKQRFIRSLC